MMDNFMSEPSFQDVSKLSALAFWGFGFFLSLYWPLAVTVEGAITNLAAPILLISMLLGWWGWQSLSRSTWWLVFGFWFFVLGGVLSLINTSNWDFAGWRFEKYYPFLLVPLMLTVLARHPRTEVAVRILFWSCLVASLSLAVFTFYQQFVLDKVRVGMGENLNPNRFGAYAFWVGVMMLSAAVTLRRGVAFWLLLTLAIAGAFYAGLASGSRGSLLGLFAGVAALAFAWLIKYFSWKRLGSILGAILVGGVGLFLVVQSNEFWSGHVERAFDNTQAYIEGEEKNTSVGTRLMMWTGAIEIWREYPLIGTGIGDPQDDLAQWIEESGSPLEKAHSRFHSIYFDSLASTGSIGFLGMLVGIFLVPLVYFLIAYLRSGAGSWAEFAALAGFATIVFYATVGLTGSWLFNRGMPPFLLAVLVLASGTVLFKSSDANIRPVTGEVVK
ncbi:MULTISPECIES: O-antigen ligase [unclassified Ectothiorhodospira]|uniref:O-antigen ligase family protein n=1 Tax=unclassified Ectothiorhodospira TaxID=2684909 RepID=UPI001EE8A2C4|nr:MULTISPECIES: O-antigen ligase family protein [unclassified Ectothiorhodospira]MCG5515135.1 O-antigen ligase family protein [Ectothiorhodospira sp. 9100]MCG5517852.1 O-antigen ligase family protein [Ectothiorhodospira sp. 9905]